MATNIARVETPPIKYKTVSQPGDADTRGEGKRPGALAQRPCLPDLDSTATSHGDIVARPPRPAAAARTLRLPMDQNTTTSTQTHIEWREKEQPAAGASKRVAAGVCGILLGWLGVHEFVLGYTGQGLILLLVTLLTLGFASPLTWLVGAIEGIVYLTKSDAEFVKTYQAGKRAWF